MRRQPLPIMGKKTTANPSYTLPVPESFHSVSHLIMTTTLWGEIYSNQSSGMKIKSQKC